MTALTTCNIELMNKFFCPERWINRFKELTHFFARNFQLGNLLGSRVQGNNRVEEVQERPRIFFEENRLLR